VLPTDLTVLAVVESNGKFLMVEERASGRRVLTQPGGHIEAGESPEEAVVREVLEESACDVAVTGLLDVYLWIHPQTRQQFLKIAYEAELLLQDDTRKLDDVIHAVHWFSAAEISHRAKDWRTPVVMRCLDDYRSGRRQPATLLADMLPLQHNVHAVLANASLV
jgi:ADP-ribose pyrophosphatase YjhB (NUDIX family)